MATSPNDATSNAASGNAVFATVGLDGLQIGTELSCAIFEERNGRQTMLLGAGTPITEDLLERLKDRNITRIRVNPNDLSEAARSDFEQRQRKGRRPRRQRTGEKKHGNGTWQESDDSFLHNVTDQKVVSFDQMMWQCFSDVHRQLSLQLKSIYPMLASGALTDLQPVFNIVEDVLNGLAEDFGLYLAVAFGIEAELREYPVCHALRTATAGLAAGIYLGLNKETLMELGFDCLVHDVGMLRIDRNILVASLLRELNAVEIAEMQKHPQLTFEMLQRLDGVPTSSSMVAYQMHERTNGTGYPRKRLGPQIHNLARIAAIADVYAAMTASRPHRPAHEPHDVMRHLLKQASEKKLDSEAVQGLMKALSLYPIGSYVELKGGHSARVVRSNGAAFTKPIVELVGSAAARRLIDLNSTTATEILRPIPDPNQTEKTEPASVAVESS